MKTNVLVVGGGGREHALAWKLKQSPQAGTIYVAPGNPGTAMLGCQNIPLAPIPNNFDMLADLACHLNIGLAVIGPDNVLADGIVRLFKNRGIPTFGPEGAWIVEASKSFAKELMHKTNIPTADFEIFTSPEAAKEYVRSKNGDVVVKADGLALGKGVRVCLNVAMADAAIEDFLVKQTLGNAGARIVIEDRLEGVELSIHALCDGEHVKLFPPVRDHKHLLDGNRGPMTGGMGVFGPIDVEPGFMERVEREIIMPCLQDLAAHGLPFVGCLYPGLMLTKDGPKVLEFNARFGDPETQVYMRLLKEDVDLIEVLLACIKGRLDKIDLRWKDEKCVCITLAAHGYPDNPRKGDAVSILWHGDRNITDPVLFHAGTSWSDGGLYTNGGRVLNLTKMITDPFDINRAYYPIKGREIGFNGMQYRKDIGRVQ